MINSQEKYIEHFWVKTYPNLLQFYNTSYTLPTRNEADGVLPNVLCIYYIKLDQKQTYNWNINKD